MATTIVLFSDGRADEFLATALVEDSLCRGSLVPTEQAASSVSVKAMKVAEALIVAGY